MSAEEAEGVEHSQYSGEGSLCWFGITVPHKICMNYQKMNEFNELATS